MRQAEKHEEIYQAAYEVFARKPNWVSFFREVLGVRGLVRRNFPDREGLAEFEQTEAYLRIQQMLTQLREKDDDRTDRKEPIKVITVRLPRSLHESLWEEAHQYKTSMNKLCISKLVQCIDEQLVPSRPWETKPEEEEEERRIEEQGQ